MRCLAQKITPMIKSALSRAEVRDFVTRVTEPLVDRFPRLIRLWVWLAFQYAIAGDCAKSLAMAEQILQRNDLDFWTLNNLGSLFFLQNRAKEAEELYNRGAVCREKVAVERDLHKLDLRIFSPKCFDRIGHTGMIHLYLKGQKLGILPACHNIILGRPEQFHNPALIRYLERHCALIGAPDTVKTLSALSPIIDKDFHLVECVDGRRLSWSHLCHAITPLWEARNEKPLLELSPEHRVQGFAVLRELGVPEGVPFCALHVREGKDHTTAGRNAQIETYTLAIAELVQRGYWVIRMGDPSMQPLPPRAQVIDYAHCRQRQDWMDIFLWAEGRFLIATGSGPSVLPMAFDKPAILTNWGPLASLIACKHDLVLPKQYWLEPEQRFLTMAERMTDRYGHQESAAAMAELGLSVQDNTPDEIRDAVIEMLERLDGTCQYTETQRDGQSRFRQIADAAKLYPATVARGFIDRYPNLM